MNYINDVSRSSFYRMRIRNNVVREEVAESMGMMVRTFWSYGLSRDEVEEEVRHAVVLHDADFSICFPDAEHDSPEFYLNIFSITGADERSSCLRPSAG